MSQNRKQAKPGLSVSTLMIASLSSLAAAVVVSRLWGGGTLIGAAMTPVIVALVSEGLNRPAKAIGTVPKAIGTVRQTRGRGIRRLKPCFVVDARWTRICAAAAAGTGGVLAPSKSPSRSPARPSATGS